MVNRLYIKSPDAAQKTVESLLLRERRSLRLHVSVSLNNLSLCGAMF